MQKRDERTKRRIIQLRQHLEDVCEEQITLEIERRKIKRDMARLGCPVLRKHVHIGEAITEIVNIHPEGIRVSELTEILRKEGFEKKQREKRQNLYQVINNILFIYTRRGLFRKIDFGVYGPRMNVFGEDEC